jgi:hypothetical protein
MPIVAATNTAERITGMAVGSSEEGGVAAWVAELNSFGGLVNSALVALREWAPTFRSDPTEAAKLLAVAEAWVCKGAEGRLDLPACTPSNI